MREVLFHFKGVVLEGHKRGKKLGFPTLNLALFEAIPEGIYTSQIKIAGIFYNALTFIGAAKTYGETEVFAETYVFDFSEDIYGEEVEVSLLRKLRSNQKFSSEEALLKQMEEDKILAMKYFATFLVELH